MTMPTKARTVRWLGRMAAVGAVALLLTETMVAPAAARERSEAVARVNRDIYLCFHGGGDPVVNTVGNSFALTCVYEDADLTWDSFNYYD